MLCPMTNQLTPPQYTLPVIIFAQFTGTSLWFAGNAVLPDLQMEYGLPEGALGGLTSAVQLGFITGTLLYAILMLADRFSTSRVFLFSAMLGALFNLGIGAVTEGYASILALRFLTGLFLAGIYPVGMKIAADWYAADLGKALGYLVGALVLGTAFPHLLRFTAAEVPWQRVMQGTSFLAVMGGLLIWWLIPEGPYRRSGTAFKPAAIIAIFRIPDFRAAALGYFGHMWELYAFWAFVPVIVLARFPELPPASTALFAFGVIGVGAIGCILGGYWSLRTGSAKVAYVMLLISGLLCLASPLLFQLPGWAFTALLFLWGFAVVGDSPQFSTLVARNAPPESRGSALTIVNSIGFAMTIFSIQGLTFLSQYWGISNSLWILFLGPVLGLTATRRLFRSA